MKNVDTVIFDRGQYQPSIRTAWIPSFRSAGATEKASGSRNQYAWLSKIFQNDNGPRPQKAGEKVAGRSDGPAWLKALMEDYFSDIAPVNALRTGLAR